MNVNDMRIAVTVLSFIAFIGLMVWAWSKRNRAGFDEAALLPFQAEERDDARRAGSART